MEVAVLYNFFLACEKVFQRLQLDGWLIKLFLGDDLHRVLVLFAGEVEEHFAGLFLQSNGFDTVHSPFHYR
jgi:hypothetical protein